MEIKLRGAAQEVGRSCIEIDAGKTRILLDCGLKLVEKEEPEYPLEVNDIEGIDSVFVSHAHLDHTGALPMFVHHGLKCGIVCTKVTKLLTKILLKDAHKVEMAEFGHPGYSKDDIQLVMARTENVEYRKKRYLKKDVSYEFFNAGHIPGSASILFNIDGKKVLYTGDFKTVDTQLINKADTSYGKVDVLIIESTYGASDHPDRAKEEQKLIKRSGMYPYILMACQKKSLNSQSRIQKE
jgi:putative mRNA 3-end processing factor